MKTILGVLANDKINDTVQLHTTVAVSRQSSPIFRWCSTSETSDPSLVSDPLSSHTFVQVSLFAIRATPFASHQAHSY